MAKRGRKPKTHKEHKKNFDKAPEGVGDVVEKITKKTGIKKVVEAVFDDCGCDERRKALNNKFRLKPKRCLNEHQFNEWTKFRERKNKSEVSLEHQALVASILRDVYEIAIKDNCSGCSGAAYKKWIGMIDKLYESY